MVELADRIEKARGEQKTRVRIPLGKETRGTQAASATPSMLNVSDAFQPSE